jgi:hypothetical protein
MTKPLSPAAKLFQQAFTKAANDAAVRAEIAGVKATGLAGGEPVKAPKKRVKTFEEQPLLSREKMRAAMERREKEREKRRALRKKRGVKVSRKKIAVRA